MRIASKLLVVIVALALMGASALAQSVSLDEVGLRYEVAEGESALTRGTVAAQAQALLGVDGDVAADSMERDGCMLIVVSQGRRVSLCVLDAPQGVTKREISELSDNERQSLSELLKREHAAQSCEWADGMGDYLLCQSGAEGALAINTLYMDTLYRGAIYSFRLEALGRELDDADRALLRAVVSRSLRLGGGERAQELAAQVAPVLTTETAETATDNPLVPLTLEPVPAVLATNTITLTGTTDPDAKLRIRVGKTASSLFSPESDGSFTVTGRGLASGKQNKVAVIASKDDNVTTLSLTVAVDQQAVPVVVSAAEAFCDADSYTVEGRTLAGADVKVKRNGVTNKAEVDENGAFSFTVNTRKEGSFAYSLSVTCLGYKGAKLSGRIIRGTESLVKKSKAPDYRKLLKNPERYANDYISLSGAIEALGYANGTPMCLVRADSGDGYVLCCDDLTAMSVGQTLRFLGRLRGESLSLNAGDEACPSVELSMLLD